MNKSLSFTSRKPPQNNLRFCENNACCINLKNFPKKVNLDDEIEKANLNLVMRADPLEGYLARDYYYPMDDPNVNRMTSDHFQIIWGKNDQTGMVNDAFIRGNLVNLEGIWDVYMNQMHMMEPSESWFPERRDGHKYKTNIYVTRTGLIHHQEGFAFMSGCPEGFGLVIVDPTAMRVNPPSWVLPHEFGHVMSAHQLGGWANNDWSGPWWECGANWFCEQYLNSTNYKYGDRVYGPDTTLGSANFMHMSYFMPHGRDYYDTWLLFQYLEENPDNLPNLGQGTVVKLWQGASHNEFPFDTIKRMISPTSLKDVLGYYARRHATLDFKHKTLYKKSFTSWTKDNYQGELRVFTELEKVSDKSGWYRVPYEFAPQQTGFNIIKLTPTGSATTNRNISVNLNGLAPIGRGADWRASIVIEGGDGKTRYSPLWSKGTKSVVFLTTDKELYLSVAATPDVILPVSCFQSPYDAPFESYKAKEAFPYEVKFCGASPAGTTRVAPLNNTHKHPNGGGVVSNTAKVADTAFVGANAMVLDYAEVKENARIENKAVVKGHAKIAGNAFVGGHSLISEAASVSDYAYISGHTQVRDSASVSGYGKVLEHALLIGGSKVDDHGVAKGYAASWGHVFGSGIVDGDYASGTDVDHGVVFGWLTDQNYANLRPDIPGLFVKYNFPKDQNNLFAKDQFGVNHAHLRGNPTVWKDPANQEEGALVLNGTNQYMLLNDNILETRELEVRIMVWWSGGRINENLFRFGAFPEKYISFIPNNSQGKASLTWSMSGSKSIFVEASNALPARQWVLVRACVYNGKMSLYFDNTLIGEVDIPIDAYLYKLQKYDIVVEGSKNLIGRGYDASVPLFKGYIDFVEIYHHPAIAPVPNYQKKASPELSRFA